MVVRGGRYFALCFFKKYTLDHYCQGVLKWKNHVHRDIFSHRSHLKLSLSKGGRYYALCFSSSKYTSNQYCQSVLTWILMPIAINFPTDRTSTIVVKRRQVLHALCFFHESTHRTIFARMYLHEKFYLIAIYFPTDPTSSQRALAIISWTPVMQQMLQNQGQNSIFVWKIQSPCWNWTRTGHVLK